MPILQVHGDIVSLGFRFGRVAYSPDISDVPEAAMPLLEGLDVWIVDALRYTAHPSHFRVRQAVEWIEKVKAKRGILMHMTAISTTTRCAASCPHIEPAYDGMVIDFAVS